MAFLKKCAVLFGIIRLFSKEWTKLREELNSSGGHGRSSHRTAEFVQDRQSFFAGNPLLSLDLVPLRNFLVSTRRFKSFLHTIGR